MEGNVMKTLVLRYKMGTEELHDAKKYLRMASEAKDQESRDMFLGLADQELGHYDMIHRSGSKLLENAVKSNPEECHGCSDAWNALTEISSAWAREIRESVSNLRTKPMYPR